MNSIFDKIIMSNDNNCLNLFITPITSYYLCDHYISTEVNQDSYKYIKVDLNIKANNLLQNNNYDIIKNNDIIQVQNDHLDFFIDIVLPIIKKNNIKVIIITSQEWLPQIHRNEKTDSLLNDENIILWISYNPIYNNHIKYLPIPYGIAQWNINNYINFLKNNNNIQKENKIYNSPSTPHGHLHADHIRNKYDIFGKNSGSRVNFFDYLYNIRKSYFVISTAGDRDDCFRHLESIGLDAIPISNISSNYKEVYEDNMIFSNAEEMINMLNNEKEITYKLPNKDILTIEYWKNKIFKRLEEINNNNYT
jgi:hypothetical protein